MFVPSTISNLTILFDMRDNTPRKKHNVLYNRWYLSTRSGGSRYSKWTNCFLDWHNEYRIIRTNTWKRIITIIIFTWTQCIWWMINILWVFETSHGFIVLPFYFVDIVYIICVSILSFHKKILKNMAR